jgi:hypothetical protein
MSELVRRRTFGAGVADSIQYLVDAGGSSRGREPRRRRIARDVKGALPCVWVGAVLHQAVLLALPDGASLQQRGRISGWTTGSPVSATSSDRHETWRDAMDAFRSARRARLRADGEVVWSWPDARIKSCELAMTAFGRHAGESTEANKPSTPARARSRNTLAPGAKSSIKSKTNAACVLRCVAIRGDLDFSTSHRWEPVCGRCGPPGVQERRVRRADDTKGNSNPHHEQVHASPQKGAYAENGEPRIALGKLKGLRILHRSPYIRRTQKCELAINTASQPDLQTGSSRRSSPSEHCGCRK